MALPRGCPFVRTKVHFGAGRWNAAGPAGVRVSSGEMALSRSLGPLTQLSHRRNDNGLRFPIALRSHRHHWNVIPLKEKCRLIAMDTLRKSDLKLPVNTPRLHG